MRYEDAGYNWFKIEIPVGYFRYPAFNNRDPYSYKEMTNDENITKENLHKLEFLAMFSFLENILI